MLDPKAGVLSMWLKPLIPQGGSPPAYSPLSSESPRRGTGPDLISPLPYLPNSMWIFLQSWLYKSLSTSLWLVFSENCSTCRCIYHVFVERGKFCALLLHHLGLNPSLYVFEFIFVITICQSEHTFLDTMKYSF